MRLIDNHGRTDVVIAAGGLETRREEWSRYTPKEFYPVRDIPWIVHVLDEITRMGRVRAAMVHHPYCERFVLAWASRARTDRSFLDFLWSYRPDHAMEPKLSLALSVYARTHPVRVCPVSSPVTDLGAPAQ